MAPRARLATLLVHEPTCTVGPRCCGADPLQYERVHCSSERKGWLRTAGRHAQWLRGAHHLQHSLADSGDWGLVVHRQRALGNSRRRPLPHRVGSRFVPFLVCGHLRSAPTPGVLVRVRCESPRGHQVSPPSVLDRAKDECACVVQHCPRLTAHRLALVRLGGGRPEQSPPNQRHRFRRRQHTSLRLARASRANAMELPYAAHVDCRRLCPQHPICATSATERDCPPDHALGSDRGCTGASLQQPPLVAREDEAGARRQSSRQ
mmetsp:Transcript_50971/g.168784  ORF Transcript_50971/g.168784 Transcript_50971/m.168784 type:complete len:263 (+) Transcript_50971:1683-2471(+)